MTEKEYASSMARESFKAYCFETCMRSGVNIEIAHAMADLAVEAWEAGYNYAMATLKENEA